MTTMTTSIYQKFQRLKKRRRGTEKDGGGRRTEVKDGDNRRRGTAGRADGTTVWGSLHLNSFTVLPSYRLTVLSHSSRNVLAGSSPAARRAGTTQAITAVPSIPSETIANVNASVAPISNNSVDI